MAANDTHNPNTRLRRLAIFMLGLGALAGCSPVYHARIPPFGRELQPESSYVVLVPSPDGTVGKVTVTGKDGQAQQLTQASQAATVDGRAIKEPIGQTQLQRDFGAAMQARPQIPEHFVLYFTNATTLSSESQALIPKILEAAQSRPVADVVVIGHTDTLASSVYNEKLALRRADHVAGVLRQAGLQAHTLSTESRGKRDLLVKTPDNTFEPKNRRVEVSVR